MRCVTTVLRHANLGMCGRLATIGPIVARQIDLFREVERIPGLGASLLTDHPVIEHRWRWHIPADPEGNESCVLQPPAGSPETS